MPPERLGAFSSDNVTPGQAGLVRSLGGEPTPPATADHPLPEASGDHAAVAPTAPANRAGNPASP